MVGATATDERGRSYNHCSEQRLLVTVDDRSMRLNSIFPGAM